MCILLFLRGLEYLRISIRFIIMIGIILSRSVYLYIVLTGLVELGVKPDGET